MFSSYEALTSGMSSNIHLTNSKLLPTSAGSEASWSLSFKTSFRKPAYMHLSQDSGALFLCF